MVDRHNATTTAWEKTEKYIQRLMRMLPPQPAPLNFTVLDSTTTSATNNTVNDERATASTPLRDGRRDENIPAANMNTPPAHSRTEASILADRIRIEAEQARETIRAERDQEMEVWFNRVQRIHEELVANYVAPGGTGQPERLTSYLEELMIHETRIRNSRVSVSERDLRDKIRRVLNEITIDMGWLRNEIQARTRTAAQPSTDTPTGAQSTIRPTAAGHPTIPLFTREMDGMTFNDSTVRGITGIAADTRANMGHV